MKKILNALRGNEDKNENSFRFLTFLLIQFLLVSLNLVAGFVTDSMALTACIGYHLATIFLLGDDVAKTSFPDTKASKIARVAVLVFDSIMVLGFSVIVINEFFVRLDTPKCFTDPIVWMMLASSFISAVLGYVYASHRYKTWKEVFVPIVVFISMILIKVFDCQILDTYLGFGVSLFVIYLAVKMIVIAWRHRKNF